MVFHRSLSDSKSPQVSRTLLSILAVLNNAVVWRVSTHPPTSKSSSPFNNPLVTVPKAPIMIGIIVIFMFHSFFNFLAKLRYLSFFSHSFSFILWSAGTAKLTILQFLFFLFIIIIIIIHGNVFFMYLFRNLCLDMAYRSLFNVSDYNTMKWTDHCGIFVKMVRENKVISGLICDLMIIVWSPILWSLNHYNFLRKITI